MKFPTQHSREIDDKILAVRSQNSECKTCANEENTYRKQVALWVNCSAFVCKTPLYFMLIFMKLS